MRRVALEVAAADEGERLDRFIAARGNLSRGAARRALDAGGVFLDGRRCKVASRIVRAGQRVVVNLEEGGRVPRLRGAARPYARDERGMDFAPLERARILYADEHLVAVDKPAGVASQP
ncbi:MAG TPA: S4 domain-containing protein, partial [Anaeromyxobacteraceae bacterium]|nr:S4 domain-containing protein [Anaeromyxobacteraceae bacterium]